MKRQTVTLSTGNKLQELMSSIESKLDLLANEDLDYSLPEPLARSQPTPHIPSSPNKPDLQMSDLAHCHSPVLSKIQQIQQQYLHQLSSLQSKVCQLQTENDELRLAYQQLEQTLGQQRQRRKALEQESSSQLDRNLEEMKTSLISRVREEMEQEAESYLQELSDMRTELSNERKNRRQLQKQIELVAMERDGFEQLYREIMQKYKQLMQADIQSATHDYKENQRVQREWKERSKEKQKEVKQKRRKSKRCKASDLPREELIPFLTKGIEELKQKLKL